MRPWVGADPSRRGRVNRIALLEIAHEKQMDLPSLPIQEAQAFHQFRDSLVFGQTPDKTDNLGLVRDPDPPAQSRIAHNNGIVRGRDRHAFADPLAQHGDLLRRGDPVSESVLTDAVADTDHLVRAGACDSLRGDQEHAFPRVRSFIT